MKQVNNQKVTLVLVAGGKGLRMGTAVPKQFLPLAGKPVIYYAAKAFLDAFPDIKIVVVLPSEAISYGNILLQSFDQMVDLTIVPGGETRFDSVKNGLKEAHAEGIIFIHDAVRPFVSKALILDCYQTAVREGTAIPAIPVTDSIRQWDGNSYKAIDREQLRSVQTPQTFRAEIIVPLFMQQTFDPSFTDEATVLEKNGIQIQLVAGSKDNIKLTTPEDMAQAESRMMQQSCQ